MPCQKKTVSESNQRVSESKFLNPGKFLNPTLFVLPDYVVFNEHSNGSDVKWGPPTPAASEEDTRQNQPLRTLKFVAEQVRGETKPSANLVRDVTHTHTPEK